MDPELKKTLDDLNAAWAEYRRANDERLAQIEAKGKAPELEAKVAKIDAHITQLDEFKSKLLALETALNRPGGAHQTSAEIKSFDGSRLLSAAEIEHRAAVIGYLRKGIPVPAEIERKALSVNSDPDGGYLVHSDMTGRIVAKIFESSPIRQLASVQQISTDALEGIADLDELAAEDVAETGARTQTGTPQIAVWRIPVHEMYANPLVTQKLLDDAAVNVEAWLAQKLTEKFARKEANHFVLGNGVGKARGFLTYPHGTARGQIQQIPSGLSGGIPTTDGGDPFIDMLYSLKEAYRARATWLANRLVLASIRKIKDGEGQYLWAPGLGAAPSTFLGLPIREAADMPVAAANSLSVALGDFAAGYQIVDRVGIRTLRDPFSNKPFVGFYSTRRVGGDVVDFDAIKLMRFGT